MRESMKSDVVSERGRLLAVADTEKDDTIRIVSAR